MHNTTMANNGFAKAEVHNDSAVPSVKVSDTLGAAPAASACAEGVPSLSKTLS